MYAIIGLVLGMLVPVFLTFKGYTIRKYSTNYNAVDLGIDSLILEQIGLSLVYWVYINNNGFNMK
jgi:hypothetical protein